MFREITLPQDTRCFRKLWEDNIQLSFQNEGRRKGETITIGPVEQLFYDHRVQAAVPFTFGGKKFYFLVSELNIPELSEAPASDNE